MLGVVFPSAICGQELLKVTGKAVIFFAPSIQEHEAFLQQEQQKTKVPVEELQFYRDQVNAFLSFNQIQDLWTTSLTIQITQTNQASITLERKMFDEPIGVILTDGKREPKVSSGVSTYIELVLMIRRYFRLQEDKAHP